MEIKVVVDRKDHEALEALADEQGRTVDEVATDAFKSGMDIFLASAGPLSTH